MNFLNNHKYINISLLLLVFSVFLIGLFFLNIINYVIYQYFVNFENIRLSNVIFSENRLVTALKFPLGIIFILIVCFVIEIYFLSYEKSSLKKILNFKKDKSSLDDIFYLIITILSINTFLSIILSFGIGFYLHILLVKTFDYNFLRDLNSFYQFIIIFLYNTFIFYWRHRLMHLGPLWHIHKVHHAALDLNMVTTQRNHPIDRTLAIPIESIPAACFGVNPDIILVYLIFNGFYQSLVHSNLSWGNIGNKFIGKYLLITPLQHRYHHGRDKKFYNKNFGIIPLWDQLFGTWLDYDPALGKKFELGFEKDRRHNTGNPLKNIFGIYTDFLKSLWKLISK